MTDERIPMGRLEDAVAAAADAEAVEEVTVTITADTTAADLSLLRVTESMLRVELAMARRRIAAVERERDEFGDALSVAKLERDGARAELEQARHESLVLKARLAVAPHVDIEALRRDRDEARAALAEAREQLRLYRQEHRDDFESSNDAREEDSF